MGRLHLNICRSMDEVDVVAVADQSSTALRYAKSFGAVRCYHDYEKLFSNEDLDAAIIALPNFLHKNCVLTAAQKGINLFVEKPLANNTSDCREIKDAVQSNGVRLMVGHNFRFFDCVTKMKEAIERGILGDIKVATLEYVINGPFAISMLPAHISDWYFNKNEIEIGIMDSGYHLIDIQRWFFKAKPRVLFSRFDSAIYDLPYEDSGTVVLQSGETRCVVNVGWFCRTPDPLKYNFRVILHGTAGFVSTDELVPNRYLHAIREGSKNVLRKLTNRKVRPLEYTYWQSSYYRELSSFFNCIRSGGSPPVTVDDALNVMEVIEEIMRMNSARKTYADSEPS